MSETQQPAMQPWASLDDFRQSAERDPALVHLLRYSVTQDQMDWGQVLREGEDSYYTAHIRRAIAEQDAELARCREQVAALAAERDSRQSLLQIVDSMLFDEQAEHDKVKEQLVDTLVVALEQSQRAEAAEARLAQLRAALIECEYVDGGEFRCGCCDQITGRCDVDCARYLALATTPAPAREDHAPAEEG